MEAVTDNMLLNMEGSEDDVSETTLILEDLNAEEENTVSVPFPPVGVI